MSTRAVVIQCGRQFNAKVVRGELRAIKNIKPCEPIILNKTKLTRESIMEIERLQKMSLEFAKRN